MHLADAAQPVRTPRLNCMKTRYQARWEAALQKKPVFPAAKFAGRGIVICAGLRLFPCAWVAIKMLRRLGCPLPIEMWHLGPEEMTAAIRRSVEPLGVRCVDALERCHGPAARKLKGWELKAFALLHCSFAEVLLLDADNVPVENPDFLFDEPEYLRTGAIFWPDFGRLHPQRAIWDLCGVSYRDEPEFESGQIVIHKARCWRALHLAMHLNEHSGYYYRFIHGDKESFHMAWRKLEQEYAMPARGIEALPGAMCQHDFQGRRIFQHRNMAKWKLSGGGARIEGFLREDECREFLRELRRLWTDTPAHAKRYHPEAKDEPARAAGRALMEQSWIYRREDYDANELRFLPNGLVEGGSGQEIYWDLAAGNPGIMLDLYGDQTRTVRLSYFPDGIWRGHWDGSERMPVELEPVGRRRIQLGPAQPSLPGNPSPTPHVVYATIYPSDPQKQSGSFITAELLKEYLALCPPWKLSMVIASAHQAALQEARTVLAAFPAVDCEFVHFPSAYPPASEEEISHCKEQLSLLLNDRGWDWLLFMDADVWTPLSQVSAWMAHLAEEPQRTYLKVKYTLRDSFSSPAETLGAYFHHRSLLSRTKYWRSIFPKRSNGMTRGAPDCNLHAHLDRMGCRKIVPHGLITAHFLNARDVHMWCDYRCYLQANIRDEHGDWSAGTAPALTRASPLKK